MHRNTFHVFYTSFEINIFCDKCISNVINGKLSAYEFKTKNLNKNIQNVFSVLKPMCQLVQQERQMWRKGYITKLEINYNYSDAYCPYTT